MRHEDGSSEKEVVKDFFRLVSEGRPMDGLKYFATDCVQHNPYVRGGMQGLLDSMVAASKEGAAKYPEAWFNVKYLVGEGDIVAAYTQLMSSRSKPEQGGLRQVHLFRFRDDKIVEYWDVTQVITPEMGNAAGAF